MSETNTAALFNKRVHVLRPTKVEDEWKVKRIGKVRSFVFHPKKAKVVGYLVKRPDLAWMFRRDDVFVATDGLSEADGMLVLSEGEGSYGRAAEKALKREHGISLDDCLIWVGLPVLTEGGKVLGVIDGVTFDDVTGNVISLDVSNGATSNAILGRKRLPARMIRGFRRGRGARLSNVGDGRTLETNGGSRDAKHPDGRRDSDRSIVRTSPGGPDHDSKGMQGSDDASLGAIIVSDDASGLDSSGGIAERAGTASAIAADKGRKAYKKVAKQAGVVKEKAGEGIRTASDAMGKAVETAGDTMEKGAFATGRQIARAGGMFSAFKDEFMSAMDGDDEPDDDGKS